MVFVKCILITRHIVSNVNENIDQVASLKEVELGFRNYCVVRNVILGTKGAHMNMN